MYSHPQHGGEKTKELRQQAGTWLKQLREQKGLSQRQLASMIDIEYYTFISQIEAGRGRIPPDRYESWAKALDIDVRFFVKTLLSYYDPVTFRLLFDAP